MRSLWVEIPLQMAICAVGGWFIAREIRHFRRRLREIDEEFAHRMAAIVEKGDREMAALLEMSVEDLRALGGMDSLRGFEFRSSFFERRGHV